MGRTLNGVAVKVPGLGGLDGITDNVGSKLPTEGKTDRSSLGSLLGALSTRSSGVAEAHRFRDMSDTSKWL